MEESPITGLARLTTDLRQEAAAIKGGICRGFGAGRFQEGGQEVRGVDEVLADCAGGPARRPVDDHWHPGAVDSGLPLPARHFNTIKLDIDRVAGPIVAQEDDHGVLAEMQIFKLLHHLADELV